MNKHLILLSFLLLPAPALADVTLLCHVDLSGAGDAGRDPVTVAGVATFEEACERVRNDPLYGEYNWRTCIDPGGAGSCGAPGPGTTTGGNGPPPGPDIGMPPSPPIGTVSIEPNINRMGQDYASFALTVEAPEQCRLACEQDSRCVAYTYVHPGYQGPNPVCWLKSAIPEPTSDPCCISGKR